MNTEDIEKAVRKSRIFVASIFGISLVIYFAWFVSINNQVLSISTSDWGAFGDFIGGILNPLIAYSAFYWLTVSVLIQNRELRETRLAMTESSQAQVSQVELAKRNTLISVHGSHLDAVNILLTAQTDERKRILDHIATHGDQYNIISFSGDMVSAERALNKVNEQIKELADKQRSLLARISAALTTDISN